MKTHVIWCCISVAALLAGMQFARKEVVVVEVPTKPTKTAKIDQMAVEKPTPVAGQMSPEARKEADRMAVRRQSETYAWMRSQKTFVSTAPFGGDLFDRGLAITLGLTPDEIGRLDALAKQTRMQLEELAEQAAKGEISEDGKTLRVTVPSLPVEGRAIYTGLLQSVKDILDDDRFELFNALAGDRFDSCFDRFALDPVTYELGLQPSSGEGAAARYAFKRIAVDGTSQSWSNGTITLKDVEADYPVLAKFVPLLK